jgi:hypothetical protein
MSTVSHAPQVVTTHDTPYASTINTGRNEAHSSGVSWAAVLAGAFIGAALWLTLLALGAGVGLSAISPWQGAGASGAAVSRGAIFWMIFMELISSAVGGYIAGRLRTKWVQVHSDEVYFRDTAHGFLVWAVAIVISAGFLTASAARLAGEVRSGADTATSAARTVDPNAYFVDALLRGTPGAPVNSSTSDANAAATQQEVAVILANDLRHGSLNDYDSQYLAQLIAARTGLTPADAQARVQQVFDQARQAADDARKAAAHGLYWLFLAMLIGAFSASYAATIGGRQRDNVLIIGA